MPVNDPFGPSVYVPDLNTGAGSASQGWATGISNLAKGLFPDPNALADARLKGAQTQQLQAAGQARSAIASALTGGDPNRFADPTFRNNFIANWAQLPAEEQNAQRSTLGTIIANTNMSGADQDQFLSHAGITNYTQTPSGVNAALANQIKTAQIGAGATIGAAQIGANATTTAATTAASGHIIGTQTEVAGRQQIADDTMVDVITPTGVQSITNKEARDGGYTRVPPNASPADIAAIITSREQPGQVPLKAVTPSHGVSPPPEATQPQTSPDGQSPTPGQALTTSITKTQAPPVPKEDPAVTLQRIANQDLPTSTWAANPQTNPQGHYNVGPHIAAAVIGRAQALAADRTSQFYLNQAGAMAQAYNEIVGPAKAHNGLAFDSGYSWFPGSKDDPPTVDFAPSYTPPAPTTPLRPNPQPAAVAPAATAAPTPLVPSNRSAIPVPNPAPAPAPAPPPRPPKPKPPPTAKPPAAPAAPAPPAAPPAPAQPAAAAPSLAAIPPAMRKPGVVYHGNIFMGGTPTDPKAWQVATPAQIETAKQNGLFAQ